MVLGAGAGVVGFSCVGVAGRVGLRAFWGARLLLSEAPSSGDVTAGVFDGEAAECVGAALVAAGLGSAGASADFVGATFAVVEGLLGGDSVAGFAGLFVPLDSAAIKSSSSATPTTAATTTRLSFRLATRGIRTVGSARDVSTGGAGESDVSALGLR